MPQIAVAQRGNGQNNKRGSNNDELDIQIGAWDPHSTGNVGANVCFAPRRGVARRSIGSVPLDSGGVGHLRSVVCEIEIGARGRSPSAPFYIQDPAENKS